MFMRIHVWGHLYIVCMPCLVNRGQRAALWGQLFTSCFVLGSGGQAQVVRLVQQVLLSLEPS